MVISAFGSVSLGGHAGVSHDDLCIDRNTEVHPAGGPGPLVDAELAAGVVGNPSGVCSAGFGGNGQCGKNVVSLLHRQAAAVVDQSKQAA